MQCILK